VHFVRSNIFLFFYRFITDSGITQHNSRSTWSKVPLQDFTPQSDINWTQSIADIDRQLYAKYGLSEEEIAFIESKVAPMD
jgi:type II restriction enzyme